MSNSKSIEVLVETTPNPSFHTFRDDCSVVDFQMSFGCPVEESPYFGQGDEPKLLESETESNLLKLLRTQNELSTTDLKSVSVCEEFSSSN